MIPRAVDQVFQVTEELKSKGWEYTLEGQFLEIVRVPFVHRYGNLMAQSSITKPSMTSSEKVNSTRRSTRSNMKKDQRASRTS